MKQLIIILMLLLSISCSIEEVDKFTPEITNGIDGQDGIDGVDGIDGIDGTDGQDGLDGENGLSTWFRTQVSADCNGIEYIFFQYHEDNGITGWQEDEEREGGESEPVCIENGTDGSDGQDGTNGNDGQDGSDGQDGYSSYIDVEIIEAGDICEHGGKRIIVWIDYNDDQIRQDGEISQNIVWCLDKCPHECVDVYDTISCRSGRVYVMWIDGIYFYNIDLTFEQFDDGTALLYGKVNKHNSTKVFLVDVTYSDIVTEDIKDHRCISIDSSEWVQYATMTGSIRAVDGSASYTVSRRGEPFQVGVGANVTSSENVFGGSGWFVTDGHNQCEGDFNFNVCR